jgi:cytochrome P450
VTRCDDVELLDLIGMPSFVRNPYPTYHRLREHPGWTSPSGYRVFSSHADVLSILRDPEHFGQEGRSEPTFSRQNPPEHTRLRALVARAFTPRSVGKQREFIHEVVDTILTPLVGHESMDLVTDLARPLPATVITRMLGVPDEDRRLWQPWLDAIGDSRGVTRYLAPDADDLARKQAQAKAAARGTADYLWQLIAERKERRGDDVVSSLLGARDGDDSLTDDEILYTLVALLGAGLHTTTGQLGNMIRALLEHPDQLRLLIHNRELLENAIEESLRYDGALQAEHREVRREASVGNVTLRRGERVLILNAAANRDPFVFDCPDTFDIRRDNTRSHLTFGFGIHHCLGAALARTQLQVVLSQMLRRLPGLRLDGAPKQHRFDRWRGLDSLPIAWTCSSDPGKEFTT